MAIGDRYRRKSDGLVVEIVAPTGTAPAVLNHVRFEVLDDPAETRLVGGYLHHGTFQAAFSKIMDAEQLVNNA